MLARTVQCLLLMVSRVFQQCTRAMLPPLLVFMAPDLGLDVTAKGQLMTAYALGYLITQVPGGALADRMGAKSLIFWPMFLSGACALAMPTAAEKFGVPGFWVLRALMGAVQGPLFPASFVHLSKWMPRKTEGGSNVDEKAWGTQMLDIGISVGSLAIIPFATTLAANLGWRHAYHFIGVITIGFALLWQIFACENPSKCWYIRPEEANFLAKSIAAPLPKETSQTTTETKANTERGRNTSSKDRSRVKSPKPAQPSKKPEDQSPASNGVAKPEGGVLGMPFSMLMHPGIWAIFVSHMAFNYGAYFETNWNAIYYVEVLLLTPVQAQVHLMMPHITNLVAKTLAPILNKFVLSRGVSLLATRRLFTSFGFTVAAIAFLPIYSLRASNPWVSTLMFSIANACFGLAPNGFKANYLDVTEVYVGIVSGYGNLLATGMSAIGPIITTFLLKTFERWDVVHLSVAVINMLAVFTFVTFSTTTPVELGKKDAKGFFIAAAVFIGSVAMLLSVFPLGDVLAKFPFDSNETWLLFCAILVGLGKGGVPGMQPVAVACFSMGAGSMPVLMSLLVCANLAGDGTAVRLYIKDVSWPVLFKVAAPCFVGVAIGTCIIDFVNDKQVKIFVAVLLLMVCAYNFLKNKKGMGGATMSYPFLCALLVIGGVASVLANLMGPVVELSLLSLAIEKKQLIATSRTLTFFTNVTKTVIHTARADLKSDDALLIVMLAACAACAAPSGKFIVSKISQEHFVKAEYFFIVSGSLNLLRKGLL